MYNKVIILGRLTQNPELKTTPSGVSVLSFSVAVDRRFQQKGEERKSDFFNCVAWRELAEHISRFWVKGKPILVEGELQNRSYVDKSNITRYVTEIIVDHVSFTGDAVQTKPAGGNTTQGKSASGTAAQAKQVPQASGTDVRVEETEDDYPF